MLEYKPAFSANRLDRYWVDAQTGTMLGWQNFTKPDGRYISSETMITRIEYNLFIPESLFSLDARLPAAFAQNANDISGFLP